MSIKWLAGFVFLLINATAANAVTITCTAPSVREGEPTSVTCDFDHDVSQLGKATVTVEHYPPQIVHPVSVLDCTPVGSQCRIGDGYTFDNHISTKLVLKITKASKQNEGRYLCKMLSPDLTDTDEVEPCNFKLDESVLPTSRPEDKTKAPSSPDGNTTIIVACAVVAVLILAVIAVIILAKIRRWLCFKTASPSGQKEDDRPASGINTERDVLLLNSSAVCSKLENGEEPPSPTAPVTSAIAEDEAGNMETESEQKTPLINSQKTDSTADLTQAASVARAPPQAEDEGREDDLSRQDGDEDESMGKSLEKPADECPAESPRDNSNVDGNSDSPKSDESPAGNTAEDAAGQEEMDVEDHTDTAHNKKEETSEKDHVLKLKEKFERMNES